jgi:hypothetical protein
MKWMRGDAAFKVFTAIFDKDRERERERERENQRISRFI